LTKWIPLQAVNVAAVAILFPSLPAFEFLFNGGMAIALGSYDIASKFHDSCIDERINEDSWQNSCFNVSMCERYVDTLLFPCDVSGGEKIA